MNYGNKIIVIYPFIPLVIKGKNQYSGISFKSLDIKHYIPRYSDVDKPKKGIRVFLDSLLNQLITSDGKYLTGLGYSVYSFPDEKKKEKILLRIRNDIEAFYYLSNKNNGPLRGQSFPKFYFIDNIQTFDNKDYLFAFNFHEELETNHHQMIYSEKAINRRIPFILKEETFIQDLYYSKEWKIFLDRNTSYRFKKAIFWINKAGDIERTSLERIIFGVIAIENLVNFKSKQSSSFADKIICLLGDSLIGIPKVKIDRFRNVLEQAYSVRSGIVHGRRIVEELHIESSKPSVDTLINFGGSRYYSLHSVLPAVFNILLENKVYGHSVASSLKSSRLIDSIYPNRECIALAVSNISQYKNNNQGFILLGEKLMGLKEYDNQEINPSDLGKLNKVINNLSSFMNAQKGFPEAKLLTISKLVRDKKSWNNLYTLAEEMKKWKETYIFSGPYSKDIGDISRATDGYIDYIRFLSNYILIRQRDRMR